MTTIGLIRRAPVGGGANRRFIRHYLEMLAAMFARRKVLTRRVPRRR